MHKFRVHIGQLARLSHDLMPYFTDTEIAAYLLGYYWALDSMTWSGEPGSFESTTLSHDPRKEYTWCRQGSGR